MLKPSSGSSWTLQSILSFRYCADDNCTNYKQPSETDQERLMRILEQKDIVQLLRTVPKTVTKRSRRLGTSLPFWISLGSRKSPSSPTTSQLGRLHCCDAVSAAREKMGRDGRATARDRPLGRPVEEPEGLALQLPWPRHRAAGSGTTAIPARPGVK